MSDKKGKKSKVYELSDEEFESIISKSVSYSDCLRSLGLVTKGGSSRTILKRRISELNISTEHFSSYENSNNGNKGIPLGEIMIENSTYTNMFRLKSRLLREGLFEYRCYTCGVEEWNGKDISLQIEHKNGNNRDHRLENLELLCPNCHSQTKTYAGRNIGKIKHSIIEGVCLHCSKRYEKSYISQDFCSVQCSGAHSRTFEITKNELENMLKESNFSAVGRKFGVGGNAIRKRCKVLGLPTEAKYYK